MSERDRKSDFEDAYGSAYTGWGDFLAEAQTDMEFYCSAQFTQQQYEWAQRAGRSLYAFNKLKRQVNLVSGYEIRNRHILKIGPIGRDDDLTAGQHTSLVLGQMAAADGYDWLSLCFKYGSLVSGSNLMEVYRDRAGQVQFGRRSYNQFLLDPMLTRADLSDCGHILTGQYVRQDKCRELVPEAERIAEIKRIPLGGGPNRWPQLPHKPSGEHEANPLRLYEEFWERQTRFRWLVVERTTGRQVPWRDFVRLAGDERRARYAVANFRAPNGAPLLSRFQAPERKVVLTIYVDGEEIWHGDNPTGLDDYNFVWLPGEFIPEMERSELKLQSFVRVLLDPSRARNKRLNQILDMMETQIARGRIFRENTLVDKEKVWQSGQGIVLEVKEGVQQPLADVFHQLDAPDIPPGMFNLLEVLDREDIQAAGLNEEIMGTDDADIPGILHSYRTGQALTGQQGVFANFRRAKRELGRKLVRLNQHNTPPREVARMIGEPPAPDFYAPDLTRFDCTPVEGLLTESQQHLWYMELKQLRAEFPDMAQYIPATMLLKAAPVQFKRELLEQVQRAEQQMAQTAQQAQETQQMMNRLIMAQAQADLARGEESRADAALQRVKAVAETEKLGTEARMELVDRALRAAELNLKAEEVRLKGRQSAKGAK